MSPKNAIDCFLRTDMDILVLNNYIIKKITNMLGFETIGNATLTIFDDKPVLTTDPWLDGKPYFESWTHAYKIPNHQKDNIKSDYIWLSHGHPDHIDPDSRNILKIKLY